MAVVDAEVDEQALVRSLKVLRKLIEEEHALEIERAACVPPLAFETATPTAAGTSRTYLFRVGGQPSQAGLAGAALKVGDGVDVVLPDGHGPYACGIVSALNPPGVVVDFSRPVEPGAIPPQGSLRVRVDDNQRMIRLQAIERVVRQRHALRWIGAVLTEADVAPLADAAWDPPSDLGLTDGQRRALAGAARSRDLFLIQGPPGTGKTTVIAAFVRYFAGQRGARVLLSSKGHRAIDNVLDRLGPSDLHVLRLGQPGKVTGAGQDVLLADVLAQAEQDVPQRHLAARTGLEDGLRSLIILEQIVTELDSLNRRVDECEGAIAQRVAEIEAGLASGLGAIHHQRLRAVHRSEIERAPIADGVGERRLPAPKPVLNPVQRLVHRLRRSFALPSTGQDREELYPVAENRVAERRRRQLGREDLVGMRAHVAELRADHHALTTRTESTLSNAAVSVSGIRLPVLSIQTADETRATLTTVRRVRGQAEAALHALRAWGVLLEQPGAVADVLVETADVIAATAVGVNSGRDGARTAELEFDVAVVDEAGQAQLTDLIVPLSRARTIILVGDHQQLPPYLDDDLLRRCKEKGVDTAWLEKSVFEHLWDRLPESHRTHLDVQFRMPEVIASFLDRVFYQGDLTSAAAKQGGGPVCSLFRSAVVLVDTSAAADRRETAQSPGFLNRCEARLVAEIAARLPSQYRTGEGLGVIAPYSAQVTTARQAVADALGLAGRDPWLVDNIATVDSFQGQERDVILVSLTRSNAEGAVGFLCDLRRLNVTLSRAREQLVIIGDLSTHGAPGGGQQRQAFARFMRDLADHVGQHGELLHIEELRRRLEVD